MLLGEGDAAGGHAGLFLHLQLAVQLAAPHGLDEAAVFGLELLGFLQGEGGEGVLLQVLLGPLVQAVVDGVQGGLGGLLQGVQADEDFLAVVPADQDALVLLNVLRADLHAQRHALHLVLGSLPAHGLVGVVDLGADAGSLQAVQQGVGGVQNAVLVHGDGDDHGLDGGDAGGQDQAVVVAVGHDEAADHPGGHAPTGLVGVVQGVVLAGEGDVKSFGEAVAEVVAGAGLERLVVVHHALDGVGLLGAVELLLVGLLALDHGHGQDVFQEVSVDVQHLLGLGAGFLGGGVHGVALLPQELPVTQEGAAGLLPAQHGAPLVVQLGQVPVGLDDVLIMLAEQRLAGGADAVALFQGVAAAHGHPGALRGEALHVVLLLLQEGFGDQHGQVDILVARFLKALVQLRLNILPDGVAIGAVDEHALDGGVVDQLRLFAHVGVPLGEIHLHVGDLFHFLFVILSHSFHPLFKVPRRTETGAAPRCYRYVQIKSIVGLRGGIVKSLGLFQSLHFFITAC